MTIFWRNCWKIPQIKGWAVFWRWGCISAIISYCFSNVLSINRLVNCFHIWCHHTGTCIRCWALKHCIWINTGHMWCNWWIITGHVHNRNAMPSNQYKGIIEIKIENQLWIIIKQSLQGVTCGACASVTLMLIIIIGSQTQSQPKTLPMRTDGCNAHDFNWFIYKLFWCQPKVINLYNLFSSSQGIQLTISRQCWKCRTMNLAQTPTYSGYFELVLCILHCLDA